MGAPGEARHTEKPNESVPPGTTMEPPPWTFVVQSSSTVPSQSSSRALQMSAERVQTPAWQDSAKVQALPSSQGVPSAAAGFEHTPVPMSQIPATWHWSSAVQTTGAPLEQVPDWQVSVCVQAFPSLQEVPSAAGGFEHTPVPVSQI